MCLLTAKWTLHHANKVELIDGDYVERFQIASVPETVKSRSFHKGEGLVEVNGHYHP